MSPIDFSRYSFSPVVHLPEDYTVLDLRGDYDPRRVQASAFEIGRYAEKRPSVYRAELFATGERNIHMGIDIGAPVGTSVHAFYDGEIFLFGYNGAEGDYGNTLVTRHVLGRSELYALYGHLSARSLNGKAPGQPIVAGEVLGWIGERHENGGWNPHLHFQLSYSRPAVPDMPGVVSERDLESALRIYPDPRLVLGPLYPDDDAFARAE